MNDKTEIRKHIRSEKNKHTPDYLARESARIMRQVEAMPEFQAAAVVMAYWSLPDEVATHEFVEKWAARKTILLPVMCGETLTLKKFTDKENMAEACLCIMEPTGEEWAEPGKIDMIIVPGMAFDKNNNRMGRGKGFYDRLLKDMRARKVGVCFEFQFLDEIPCAGHDVKMDAVVR